ncbi:dehydrogenase/reductase SDR family member 11-like [Patella vulgata]|uniref:dehydrogenase/reductase SDR family member 11-like n=1 Tax=Patella vulgata TaxID=6465 RepID=UPI00218091E9|nr:dehydrogenase/reductase SDR family member 11-like [Patella vulgata]
MERWVGRVALVTGASAGIGAAIARDLVCFGMKVVGCSRNIENIQKLSDELKNEKGSLTAIRCDLSKEEDIIKMFKTITSNESLGGVDVCINNAGLAHNAPILSGKTQEWREMLDVNVMAVTICTREAFQSMKERNVDDGHIIFINSMSGHRIPPKTAVHFYSATKYAVTALMESTRQELRELKSHIRVTGVSPGLVETEFSYRMNKDEEKAKALYSSILCLKGKDISNAVVYALQAPSHVEINDVLIRPTEQTY